MKFLAESPSVSLLRSGSATLHPPIASSIAACIQWGFDAMLRWAVGVPINTWLELLHILANQPPIGTLVAKQLTCYACTIEEDLAHATHE